MILLVDTTRYGEIRVGVYGTRLRVMKKNTDGPVRGQLLNVIDELLRSLSMTVHACTGIVVAIGPGPFSALRSAAAIANALGYAQKIPVVGIKGEHSLRELAVLGKKKMMKTAKVGTIIVPHYGAPPHITKAKRR